MNTCSRTSGTVGPVVVRGPLRMFYYASTSINLSGPKRYRSLRLEQPYH